MFQIKTILCPVDFSDASKKALRYAPGVCFRVWGLRLCCSNVVEPRPMAVDISLNYVPLGGGSGKKRPMMTFERVLKELQELV